MAPTDPVVLDLDASVGALPGEHRLPLAEWQEAVRFGCTLSMLRRFTAAIDPRLPARHGPVLLGSGDFHHLSWPLIERCAARRAPRSLRVVVLDNHPDNMRFPFGVHCGSWVRRVARLPAVAQVHVLGITSGDIGWRHAWENHWAPLRAGRLVYWSTGVDVAWARRLGLGQAFRSFASADALVDAACQVTDDSVQPATSSTCEPCATASLLIITEMHRASPAAITPAPTVPVALTVSNDSSVSVSTTPATAHVPVSVPYRTILPVTTVPPVTVNVAEPVLASVAYFASDVDRTEPVSAPDASVPEVPVASCVQVASGAVTVALYGL